jgi:hypothetical protein
MSNVKVGSRIRRLADGRIFRVSFVNRKGAVPVFSADSDDGQWSNWGGPLAKLAPGVTYEAAGSNQ